MEDPRIIDGPGIDTKEERDQLNYQPVIEYTKPQVNASLYVAPSNIEVTLLAIVQPKILDTWGRIIDISTKLNTIEDSFSNKLKDSYAIIPQKMLTIVTNAASKFGYPIINNKLPFDLYKKVLQSSDSHEKMILQDTFENYQSDVDGTLIGELYPDVVEMQEDWQNTINFTKSGLLAQIVESNKLPQTDDKTSSNLLSIGDQEKKLSDSYVQASMISDQYANTMRQIYVIDPTSQAFLDAQSKYTDQKRKLNDLERRLATKNDVVSLLSAKADNVEPFLNALVNFSNMNTYKGTSFDLLYNLLSQYNSGQDMENGLRKVQALLKLSIDGKIESVDGVKTNIRGISNNQTKLNVNKSLVKSIHLRTEVYGEVYDTINGFRSTPDNAVFNMVAGHIVDSIYRADNIYTEQSGDFYKISSLDTELRRDKLMQLVDKDTARQFYQIIVSLISYAQQKSWPSKAQLVSWLKDFVNYEGL